MAAKTTKPNTIENPAFDWPFGRKNYILFAIALMIIVIGYICLGYGDDPNAPVTLTVAPILLVIGYLIIPFAIMAKGKPDTASAEGESTQSE